MKKTTRNVLIGVIIVFALFVLMPKSPNTGGFSSGLGNGVVKINYVKFMPLGSLKPLVFVQQNQVIKKGDSFTFQDQQGIDESCNTVKFTAIVKQGFITYGSDSTDLGSSGPRSAQWSVTVDTTALNVGSYTLEAIWTCNGVVLGNDGKFGGTTEPSRTTFIVTSGSPPDDKKYCWQPVYFSKTCQRVSIPSTSTCVGDYLFYDNEQDCLRLFGGGGSGGSCSDSQILINGVCKEKKDVCVADGGTKLCGGTKFDIMSLIPFIAIGLIIWGIMARKQK